MANKYLWWQKGIIYQIYPRSFMDAGGVGVGNLSGIIARLDYLKRLGIDAVWISPIFPSPMADFGYDISDYTAIHPLFGTMDDFDFLLEEAHRRDIRIILDLVPNHTSEKHSWFLESRSSRDNPKRGWYIWRDPAPDGGAPNNWLSAFGGSAWEWDENTGQYYYHAFLKEQPDLNWRSPDVRRAMFDVMRFWFDKGVDGFRVDVMWHLIKDKRFRNNPRNPDYRHGKDPLYHSLIPAFTTDQHEVHDIVTMMRRVADEYDERVLIGEVYLAIGELVTYYGRKGLGAHLPFNFLLISLPWDAPKIASAVSEYEGALPPRGWPNWVIGNHDNPRIASRVGAAQARVAAMLLLTLRGTPTMYYGDEIGMRNVDVPPERIQDPLEKNVPGLGLGRDPQRSPMQWNAGPNAGFTAGAPWLPIADDYSAVNVETERNDAASMLTLYKRLITLRRAEPALSVGDYVPLNAEGNLIAYIRQNGKSRFLVALNLGQQPNEFPLKTFRGVIVLATYLDRKGETAEGTLSLRENEGLIVKL